MWEYKREEQKFDVIPEGQYRIRVKSAEKARSKSGNDMLALQFEVSGQNSLLYHYIVFMPDKKEITNRMLTQFYDAFKDIPEGDANLSNWIGKIGACKIKHDEYNGNPTAKVSYFIKAEKQADLPAWSEPKAITTGGFMQVTDKVVEDKGLPFD